MMLQFDGPFNSIGYLLAYPMDMWMESLIKTIYKSTVSLLGFSLEFLFGTLRSGSLRSSTTLNKGKCPRCPDLTNSVNSGAC